MKRKRFSHTKNIRSHATSPFRNLPESKTFDSISQDQAKSKKFLRLVNETNETRKCNDIRLQERDICEYPMKLMNI